LKIQDHDWYTSIRNRKRFVPFYGDDNSGDIFTNYHSFVSFVLKNETLGVDYVVADGGDKMKLSVTNLNQENEFRKLITHEFFMSISCVKNGGNILVKIFGTVTKFMKDLLTLVSCCFHKIAIVKPSASRNLNAEKYFLGFGKKQCRKELDLLLKIIEENTYNSFLEENNNIEKYLTDVNVKLIESQIYTSKKVVNKEEKTENYDLTKPYKLWQLK